MKSVSKKFLPLVDGESKIDLSMEADIIEIKLSTWTDGLGWCEQKTIRVPDSMLDDLHHLIAAARISRDRHSHEDAGISKVLRFPN
jgi:hypothetical protein